MKVKPKNAKVSGFLGCGTGDPFHGSRAPGQGVRAQALMRTHCILSIKERFGACQYELHSHGCDDEPHEARNNGLSTSAEM